MAYGRKATTVAAFVCAAGLVMSGCGGGGSSGRKADDKPTASAATVHDGATTGVGTTSATPEQILAQIKGEKNVAVTITSVVRDPSGFVTVQGTIANEGNSVFSATEWRGTETALVPSGPSVAGAVLVDEAGKKRYYVLRDTEGKCLCTMGLMLIQPKEIRPFFAQFPSPPATTTEVEFELPTMPPAKITLTDGKG
jgi:hypothetical protein